MRRGGQYLAHISRPHSSRAAVESLVGAAAEADLAPPRDVERRKGAAHISQSGGGAHVPSTDDGAHALAEHTRGIAHGAVCAFSGRRIATDTRSRNHHSGALSLGSHLWARKPSESSVPLLHLKHITHQ